MYMYVHKFYLRFVCLAMYVGGLYSMVFGQ